MKTKRGFVANLAQRPFEPSSILAVLFAITVFFGMLYLFKAGGWLNFHRPKPLASSAANMPSQWRVAVILAQFSGGSNNLISINRSIAIQCQSVTTVCLPMSHSTVRNTAYNFGFGTGQSLKTFYEENSYQKFLIKGINGSVPSAQDVYLVTISNSNSNSTCTVASPGTGAIWAQAAVTASGITLTDYPASPGYDEAIVVFPNDLNCGADIEQAGILISFAKGFNPRVIHESSHQLLHRYTSVDMHASAYPCKGGKMIDVYTNCGFYAAGASSLNGYLASSAVGRYIEYGHAFDMMGDIFRNELPNFSAYNRQQLGWLKKPSDPIKDNSEAIVSNKLIYTLASVDRAPGNYPQQLTFAYDEGDPNVSSNNYYIEYREAKNQDPGRHYDTNITTGQMFISNKCYGHAVEGVAQHPCLVDAYPTTTILIDDTVGKGHMGDAGFVSSVTKAAGCVQVNDYNSCQDTFSDQTYTNLKITFCSEDLNNHTATIAVGFNGQAAVCPTGGNTTPTATLMVAASGGTYGTSVTISSGSHAYLKWASTNATSCQLTKPSGAPPSSTFSGTSGADYDLGTFSNSTSSQQNWVYSLKCSNSSGTASSPSTVTVNVNPATTACTRSNPTVTLNPTSDSQAYNNGAQLTFVYTATIKNNDSSGCINTLQQSFDVVTTQPSGWPSVIQTTVNPLPGQTSQATLNVKTPNPSPQSGQFDIYTIAKSKNPTGYNSASMKYTATINGGTTSCTRNNPTLTIAPNYGSVTYSNTNAMSLTYALTLKSNDTLACTTGSTYTVTINKPTDTWKIRCIPPSYSTIQDGSTTQDCSTFYIKLQPGAAKTVDSVKIIAPAGQQPHTYYVDNQATSTGVTQFQFIIN